MQDDEWGPWIEHDGSGFPAPLGAIVHRRFDETVDMVCGNPAPPTMEIIGPLNDDELRSWDWSLPRNSILGRVPWVIRYRVRKSASFEMLKQLVELRRPVERHAKEPV